MTSWERRFRKASIPDRRNLLRAEKKSEPLAVDKEEIKSEDFSTTGQDKDLLELADAMVEQAFGYFAVPLGIVSPLLIDGCSYKIPLATEEASVIAAASYGASLLSSHGGIITEASEPVMKAQIFLEKLPKSGEKNLAIVRDAEEEIRQYLSKTLENMEKRGGGWRGLAAEWMSSLQSLVVTLHIDVRNAMGANLLNSAAEKISPLLEKLTGGRVLMAIVSNRSWARSASAHFHLPVKALRQPNWDGRDVAQRIVRASCIAQENPDRAVTHNKGIMNGITALALATANDTRAIEASAHSYAGRKGRYQGLSHYSVEKDILHAHLRIPLPFAVTGGAVGFHPASRWALNLLKSPDAPGLSRIAAALGLAQNLAALCALVSNGIQKGHMPLHTRRFAFLAGREKRKSLHQQKTSLGKYEHPENH